jgi:hypothetical protein
MKENQIYHTKTGYPYFAVRRMLATAIACGLCASACQTIVSEHRATKTEIITDPAGATIAINGKYVGNSPVSYAFQQNAGGFIIGNDWILTTPIDVRFKPESEWVYGGCKVPSKLFIRLKPSAAFVGSNGGTGPLSGTAALSAAPEIAISQPRSVGTTPADLPTRLEGCYIVANDGQYLGIITQNTFSEKSILNEFGKYGSKFSAVSIFDEFGRYGSKFSHLSPFNQFTSTPPQIRDPSGQFVAYLTKNKVKSPAIDPEVLIALLKGGVPSENLSADYVVDSEHWIEAVMDDGNLIKLEDGSLWKVSPTDVAESALWLPVTSVTVIDSDDPNYPYKLVNTDDNEAVEAQLIR